MQSNESSYLKDKRYAARFLGVSIYTIDRWVMNGVGPRFIRVGKQVRFKPEDLADFVERNASGGAVAA